MRTNTFWSLIFEEYPVIQVKNNPRLTCENSIQFNLTFSAFPFNFWLAFQSKRFCFIESFYTSDDDLHRMGFSFQFLFSFPNLDLRVVHRYMNLLISRLK